MKVKVLAHQAPLSMEFSRQEYSSGSPFPSPEDLPDSWSNLGLLHWKLILYHLSHQGRPRILEWIAYPFSGGSSQPKDRTGVSCIAGRFFTSYQGGPNIAVAYPNYTWCVFVCFLALFTEVSAMDTHAEITAALGYCSCTFFLQLDFLYFIDLIAYLHEGSPKVQYSRGKKK